MKKTKITNKQIIDNFVNGKFDEVSTKVMSITTSDEGEPILLHKKGFIAVYHNGCYYVTGQSGMVKVTNYIKSVLGVYFTLYK